MRGLGFLHETVSGNERRIWSDAEWSLLHAVSCLVPRSTGLKFSKPSVSPLGKFRESTVPTSSLPRTAAWIMRSPSATVFLLNHRVRTLLRSATALRTATTFALRAVFFIGVSCFIRGSGDGARLENYQLRHVSQHQATDTSQSEHLVFCAGLLTYQETFCIQVVTSLAHNLFEHSYVPTSQPN